MKTENEKSADVSFPNETKYHKMNILLDDGVYRHIDFRNPSNSFNQFALTTWPNYLCVSGDMGTYVFQRTEDMFKFFNTEKPNYSYWAEKCESTDGKYNEGILHFSRYSYLDQIDYFIENCETEDEKENLSNHFLVDIPTNTIEAIERLYDYDNGDYSDYIDERIFKDYSYHYYWLCQAICWGVKKYYKEKGNIK